MLAFSSRRLHEVEGPNVVFAHELIFVSARPSVEAQTKKEEDEADDLGSPGAAVLARDVFLLVVPAPHEQSDASDDEDYVDVLPSARERVEGVSCWV